MYKARPLDEKVILVIYMQEPLWAVSRFAVHVKRNFKITEKHLI